MTRTQGFITKSEALLTDEHRARVDDHAQGRTT